MTLSFVIFPNPFGSKPAAAAEVEALREKHGFSAAYAEFLCTQNGFTPAALAKSKERARYVKAREAKQQGPDFARLYSANELPAEAKRVRALRKYFFPIGQGYGGDHYAEVLCGKHRGSIVSLNHEAYLGVSSFAELAEGYDDFEDFDVDFEELGKGARASFLVDTEDLDLAQKIAPSLEAFLASCIALSNDDTGRTVPAPVVKKAKAAAKAKEKVNAPSEKPAAKKSTEKRILAKKPAAKKRAK